MYFGLRDKKAAITMLKFSISIFSSFSPPVSTNKQQAIDWYICIQLKFQPGWNNFSWNWMRRGTFLSRGRDISSSILQLILMWRKRNDKITNSIQSTKNEVENANLNAILAHKFKERIVIKKNVWLLTGSRNSASSSWITKAKLLLVLFSRS